MGQVPDHAFVRLVSAMRTKIKIEKGIPIPPLRDPLANSVLQRMRTGDSFAFTINNVKEGNRARALYSQQAQKLHLKITTRQIRKNGKRYPCIMRIWRVK